MNKAEYADLLIDIAGSRDLGLAAREERKRAEQLAVARHDEELWALLSLGDAVDQFYRDTLEMIREKMLVSELSETHAMMVHWHIVSFERFAVAFDLMSRAYYFEAIALARDLWEIALSLAALKRDVISLRELLAAGATTSRDMETASRRGLQD